MKATDAVNARQKVKDGILSYLLSNGYGHSGRYCNISDLAQKVGASLTTVTRLCLELSTEGRIEYYTPITAEVTARWTSVKVEAKEGLNIHCRATFKAQQERYEITLFALAQLQEGDFRATITRSWISIWLAILSVVISLVAVGWSVFSDSIRPLPVEVILKPTSTNNSMEVQTDTLQSQ